MPKGIGYKVSVGGVKLEAGLSGKAVSKGKKLAKKVAGRGKKVAKKVTGRGRGRGRGRGKPKITQPRKKKPSRGQIKEILLRGPGNADTPRLTQPGSGEPFPRQRVPMKKTGGKVPLKRKQGGRGKIQI
jgi:hypothetical protein